MSHYLYMADLAREYNDMIESNNIESLTKKTVEVFEFCISNTRYADLIFKLLDKGVPIDTIHAGENVTLLGYAVTRRDTYKHFEKYFVPELLKRGADPTIVCDFLKQTPLHLCVRFGGYPILKLLLDACIVRRLNVNKLDENGCTAMDIACATRAINFITPLKKAGGKLPYLVQIGSAWANYQRAQLV